jgi:hypothetical protein
MTSKSSKKTQECQVTRNEIHSIARHHFSLGSWRIVKVLDGPVRMRWEARHRCHHGGFAVSTAAGKQLEKLPQVKADDVRGLSYSSGY